jgi:hypothetical protein
MGYFLLLGLIPIIIVAIVFTLAIKASNKTHPLESGKVPIYSEKGGGRFDDINWTMPFVRISIYDEFLLISYSEEIVFRYNEITKIEIKNHFISDGIHIYHNKKGIPSKIILWPANPAKVLELLQNKLVEYPQL